jgi:hypothetical protein
MEARCEAAGKPLKNLLPGDMYMMPDGGRNISSKFRNLFVDEDTKTKLAVSRKLNVLRSEEGLAARRRVSRHLIKQLEPFHVYTGARLKMAKKSKRHFTGTNLGDSLTEVPVPLEDELWATDKATKKAIYSSKNFILVGGRADSGESEDEDDEDDAADEQEPPFKKAKTDTIPVFFHELPKVLTTEIINLYCVVGVIDLTAGAGTWAKACLDAGIPYFGVALTLKHQEELSNHLVEYVKAAQLNPQSPLFVRGLVVHTAAVPKPKATPKPTQHDSPEKRSKKDKTRKGKHSKKKSSSSDSDSSSSPAQ